MEQKLAVDGAPAWAAVCLTLTLMAMVTLVATLTG